MFITDYQDPEQVVAVSRKFYRLIPDAQRPVEQGVILRLTAKALGLDHEDYYDLVRHLVTAAVVDPDAYRWATTDSGV